MSAACTEMSGQDTASWQPKHSPLVVCGRASSQNSPSDGSTMPLPQDEGRQALEQDGLGARSENTLVMTSPPQLMLQDGMNGAAVLLGRVK